MPISLKRLSRRVFTAAVALMILVGTITSSLVTRPAEAAYHQSYIQTTVDTSIWEILAGVIDTKAGWFENAIEYQRLGGTLEDLADTDMPAAAASLINNAPSSSGGNAKENLVMVFPGDASPGAAPWRASSSSKDTARATLVRNALIYDLNTAFKFAYGDAQYNYEPGGSTADEKLDAYRSDMESFLGHISGSDNSTTIGSNSISFKFYSSNSAQFDRDLGTRAMPDGVTTKSDYVCITRNGDSQYFLFRMPKGYVDIDGASISDELGLINVSDSKDAKYIHWGTFAVEAFINYSCDEKIAVTVDEVYNSTPSAFEKAVAGFLGSICNWITGALGLWSFDDLIFNSGVRGTTSYVGGIFPTSWQPLIWTFFFIAELGALLILLYSIIFNVGKKALSTVNPIARANAIEQIQYLFIVAIALGLLPIVLQLLINVSYNITGIFVDALGGRTATARFETLASNAGGIGSVLTYIIYLGAVIYFNIFYGIRALTLALLIILGPIFIACLGVSENKRMLTITWAKEVAANLFIQPLQALMMCFILMVPATGRNIDSIIMAYAMIPLTHMIRGLFFGSSGGFGHQLAERGKQSASKAGMLAGGIGIAGAAGGIMAGVGSVKKLKSKDGEKDQSQQDGAGSGGGSSNNNTSGGAQAGQTTRRQSASTSTQTGAGAGGGPGGAASGAAGPAGAAANGGGGAGSPSSTAADSQLSPGVTKDSDSVSSAVKENIAEGASADTPPAADSGPTGSGGAKDSTAAGTGAASSGGTAGGSSASPPSRHLAKGIALTGAAVALGALGGATSQFNRRVFGVNSGKNGGLITQLSSKVAGKANTTLHPQAAKQPDTASGATDDSGSESWSNPYCNPDRLAEKDESVNPYTQGIANRKAIQGGSAYHIGGDALKEAGVDHVQQDRGGSTTLDYNLSTLNPTDATRAATLQAMWEHGTTDEHAALEAAGIQDVQPTYRYEGGKEVLSGVSVTADQTKLKQNFGIDTAPAASGGKGITMTASTGGAPALVPEVAPYMASSQASCGAFAKRVEMAGGAVTPDPTNAENVIVQAPTKAAFQKMEQSVLPEGQSFASYGAQIQQAPLPGSEPSAPAQTWVSIPQETYSQQVVPPMAQSAVGQAVTANVQTPYSPPPQAPQSPRAPHRPPIARPAPSGGREGGVSGAEPGGSGQPQRRGPKPYHPKADSGK